MKKIINLLLVFSVCLCSLSSCGKDSDVLDTNISSIDMGVSCPTSVRYCDRHNISLNKTEFIGVPEYIVCTIDNFLSKTVDFLGDPADCQTIFIEKNYDKLYDTYITKNYNDIYQPITSEEARGRWERIPFEFDGALLKNVSKSKLTGLVYLENNLKSTYEFTPGTYRLVVCYTDGSYGYANFAIYAE